jgi:hypothetical protein
MIADAEEALHDEDLTSAAAALELLVDLACETRGFEYFRSEDPIRAGGGVFDAVPPDGPRCVRSASVRVTVRLADLGGEPTPGR